MEHSNLPDAVALSSSYCFLFVHARVPNVKPFGIFRRAEESGVGLRRKGVPDGGIEDVLICGGISQRLVITFVVDWYRETLRLWSSLPSLDNMESCVAPKCRAVAPSPGVLEHLSRSSPM